MKAERRHELKHNELSDWLGERMETLKPHATGILLGIGLLAAIVLGSVWYFSGESAAASRAWSQYFQAFSEREPQKVLQNLAEEQSGSKAAWWAVIAVGDMNLSEGAALLFTDRTEARKRLEAAREAYKKVELSDDPMLKTRARLGLAKVNESLCQPKEALKYYEMVATSEKDSAIGKAAAADARRMKDQREVDFLDWFAAQTPKRPAPFPGMGGGVPGLPNDLPERPNIDIPKGLGLDNIGTGVPAEPRPHCPQPGLTTPATAPLRSSSGRAPRKRPMPSRRKRRRRMPAKRNRTDAALSELELAADQPLELVVGPDSAGQRLDAFLARELPKYSRVQLRKVIGAGGVKVNGQGTKVAYRLSAGDQIVDRAAADEYGRSAPGRDPARHSV